MSIGRISQRRLVLAAVAFAAALLAPLHAGAQVYLFGGYYGEDEIKLLPPFCRYAPDFNENVQGGRNPAEIERWKERLGSTYIHIHHWCYGLIGMNRGDFKTNKKSEKERYCIHMINEATYVIQRSAPNFVLMPEFYTMRGRCNLLLKKLQPGFLDLRKAMDLKPDYWPPYVLLSDFLKDLGDIKQAREVLQEGLSHAPESKTLKTKLADLDALKDRRPADAAPANKSAADNTSARKAASPEAKDKKAAPPEAKEAEKTPGR